MSFNEALTDIVAERFDAGIRIGERIERDMIEQRNDPDAITDAIARMKLDLRTGNGSGDPPAA